MEEDLDADEEEDLVTDVVFWVVVVEVFFVEVEVSFFVVEVDFSARRFRSQLTLYLGGERRM